MESEEAAQESGGLSYDEAKEIALAYLVLVKKLQGKDWVPSFVGRSDIYIVNKMGGLTQKNRRHGAEFYANGDGAAHCWGSTSCTTTVLRYDLKNLSFGASCA